MRKKPIADLKRKSPYKEKVPSILIVCEGKNTEKSYFEQFRLQTLKVEPVGTGLTTINLVKKAKKLADNGNYQSIWCVFDKDNTVDFDEAIKLANSYGFKVGYSNQAFEYWILLHFIDHQGSSMHRNSYCSKLNKYLKPLNCEYDKVSKIITTDIFDELERAEIDSEKLSRRELACRRAERINSSYEYNIKHSLRESSTTVCDLIRYLEKYI